MLDKYKQIRLKYLQDKADEKGLGEFKKEIVSQVLQENGDMTANRKGDNGCSIGLTQINICRHGNPRLRNHPKLYNWKWQLDYYLDTLKRNYDKYKNIERSQVCWNSPIRCKRGDYKTKYYYEMRKHIKKLDRYNIYYNY